MRRNALIVSAIFGACLLVSLSPLSGCGGSNGSAFTNDGGPDGGGDSTSHGRGNGGAGGTSGVMLGGDGGGRDGGGSGNESGSNECPIGSPAGLGRNVSCPSKKTTTVTGKVYDPAKKNGLYNVAVYVPAVPLVALPKGVPTAPDACSCGALYQSGAVVNTTTAVDGTFTLSNVPVGSNVPLVLQIGKWRRYLKINVKACDDNAQPDKSSLPAGHGGGRRHQRQHPGHRGLDRPRRHPRVPHAPHRAREVGVRRGDGHERSRAHLLGRRSRDDAEQDESHRTPGVQQDGGSSGQLDRPLVHPGAAHALRHRPAVLRGSRDGQREPAGPRSVPQRGRTRVRVTFSLRVVQRAHRVHAGLHRACGLGRPPPRPGRPTSSRAPPRQENPGAGRHRWLDRHDPERVGQAFREGCRAGSVAQGQRSARAGRRPGRGAPDLLVSLQRERGGGEHPVAGVDHGGLARVPGGRDVVLLLRHARESSDSPRRRRAGVLRARLLHRPPRERRSDDERHRERQDRRLTPAWRLRHGGSLRAERRRSSSCSSTSPPASFPTRSRRPTRARRSLRRRLLRSRLAKQARRPSRWRARSRWASAAS